MPDRPIVLTGFMGTGKSSVARLLASSLQWPLIDLDQEIVQQAGKSINQIFSEEGEAAFRTLESSCLEQVLQRGRGIVAGGGGVVLSEQNRGLMRQQARVVNLTAPLPVIMQRLNGASDRPLFASGEGAEERVKALMEQREQFYREADIRIDTANKSVEDVAAEILRIIKGLPA